MFDSAIFHNIVQPWLIKIALAIAIAIAIAGYYISRWTVPLVEHALRKARIDVMLIGFIISITRTIFLLFSAIAALSQLGLDTTSLVALVGAAGIAVGLALLFSLILAIPAFAGGWAIITLDELPTNVVAGEPLTVGFTVLQHGKTPMPGLYPTITVTLPKSEHFVVNAEPKGKPGHYTATLTIPKEGDWEWSIQAFTLDQPMPTLSVAAPVAQIVSQPVVKGTPTTVPSSLLPVIRITALGVGLAGLVFAFRRKSRLAVALPALCLLVGIGSFVMDPTVPTVEAQSEPSSAAVSESTIPQVEAGRQLFIAKGCIACHANDKVSPDYDYGTINVGAPDLTNFSASPETLRLRLKDPSVVKSDSWMPNLNLSDSEIEALIVFVNTK